MKTIKDAIQASSIEQRRRILNNISIDKDSKNFIVRGEASQANGGSDLSNIPCYYYKIIKTPNDEIEFNMLLKSTGYFEYVVNVDSEGTFQTNTTNAYWDYTNVIACKLIDIPIITSIDASDKISTIIISGDIVNRFFTVYSKAVTDITIDMIQQQLDTYCTQITKEEYESLITIKSIE